MSITVRYFAAARAAAGVESEWVEAPPGITVAELVELLAQRNATLAPVLKRCSFLCDEVAVRNRGSVLSPGTTFDVLPPFAGG